MMTRSQSLLLRSTAAVFFLTFAARPDYVAATLSAGGWPDAIAVNPVTGTAYIADPQNDSLSIIDGALQMARIRVGRSPACRCGQSVYK